MSEPRYSEQRYTCLKTVGPDLRGCGLVFGSWDELKEHEKTHAPLTLNSLVEKLREHAPQMGHYGAHAGGGLMEQAADEIERLHAMLLDAGMQLTENARLLLEHARRHHDQPLLHGMEHTAAVTQPGPGAVCSPAGRGLAVNCGYIPTACGYIIREGSQQGEWIATFKSIDLADEYVRLRSAQKTAVVHAPKHQSLRKDTTKLDSFGRCAMCEWEVIDGEAVHYARKCCEEGEQFDLSRGLPLNGSGEH